MARKIRCPVKPRFKGDIVGCGSTNVSGPDDEGLYDCNNCGIWFNPKLEGSGFRKWMLSGKYDTTGRAGGGQWWIWSAKHNPMRITVIGPRASALRIAKKIIAALNKK